MNATRILAGRREGDLLAFPSVRRMTDLLSQRCRESSWVRTSVASLERFRAMTGYADLEVLREQALVEPVLAEQALARFALALAAYTRYPGLRTCDGCQDLVPFEWDSGPLATLRGNDLTGASPCNGCTGG